MQQFWKPYELLIYDLSIDISGDDLEMTLINLLAISSLLGFYGPRKLDLS